jgi:hypothetical protein
LNQAGKVIDKMKQLLLGALALIASATPTPAQKIDTETASREHVVRVQTAMNHLTVIEVAEPVATVAVGSPQAFRVERRENKVLIEPLQENVATNLFIWTASTRLNYELIPAVSDAGQMDFAIDYHQSPQVQVIPQKATDSAPAPSAFPAEMLLNSTPVRMVGGPIGAKANLSILIRDVYRKQDVLFVRYSLENRSSQTLRAGRPTVESLNGLKFDQSLWSYQNSQLGAEYTARLKTAGAPTPVKVTQCEPGIAEVSPGQAQMGLITLQLPAANPQATKAQPTVLQILFPVDRLGNLTATLVL